MLLCKRQYSSSSRRISSPFLFIYFLLLIVLSSSGHFAYSFALENNFSSSKNQNRKSRREILTDITGKIGIMSSLSGLPSKFTLACTANSNGTTTNKSQKHTIHWGIIGLGDVCTKVSGIHFNYTIAFFVLVSTMYLLYFYSQLSFF